MRQTVATVLTAALLITAGCSTALTGSSGGTGTVNFYVSDQPGAIEDFEHLNVTVGEVTFVREDGNQTTYDANTTMDLTRLQGANASLVERYEVQEANYTKVFMSVDGIDATLTSGESTNVKLPSEKLQLNQNFTVGNGDEVDFVYDIMVMKAGNSGKCVLRPVASESGTGVEIEKVDTESEMNGDDEDDDDATATPTATQQGSMAFYVSDEQNAIDDFEHLNVTVTEIGF